MEIEKFQYEIERRLKSLTPLDIFWDYAAYLRLYKMKYFLQTQPNFDLTQYDYPWFLTAVNENNIQALKILLDHYYTQKINPEFDQQYEQEIKQRKIRTILKDVVQQILSIAPITPEMESFIKGQISLINFDDSDEQVSREDEDKLKEFDYLLDQPLPNFEIQEKQENQ